MMQTNTHSRVSGEATLYVPSSPSPSYAIQEAQLQVWLASQQSDAANCAYNEIATLTLDGKLNREALESSLQNLYQRHGSLRSTFDRDGSYVIERPYHQLQIEWIDWTNQPKSQATQLRGQLIEHVGSTPFDLQQGPLFRAILQRESEQKHYLTVVAHHLVLDGWSLAIVVKELGEFYGQIVSKGNCQSAGQCASYADYADAMRSHSESQAGQSDLAYWISQFDSGVPSLDLPTTGNRGAIRSYRAGRIQHKLSKELVAAVRKMGAKNGCSLYNTVLAAFQAFVARIAHTGDIVLAIPTAGQSAMDFPGLVGHCVNTLPLRVQVDCKNSFKEHLKLSRSGLLSGMDHQRFSFGTLLKHLKEARDPSRPPLCAVSFNLDPVVDLRDSGFTGLDVTLEVEPRAYENFEWFVNGVIHKDQSIELQVQFNSDLFAADYIAYYFQGFQAFLEHVAEKPDAMLFEAPVMSIQQRQEMIVQWNDTKQTYPSDSNLASEFSRQANSTPHAIAVRSKEGELTYLELDRQSEQFARLLSQRGIRTGDLVGICTARTSRLLVQLLGILKAGAGYVPLDPQYPLDRLRHMCDDSQLKLIVSEKELHNIVSAFDKPVVMFDELNQNPLDADFSPCLSNPSDVCYMIYTSGSTGKPKGVMVPHGAVVNFLYSMKEQPGYTPKEKLLAVTTLSFDISVLEVFLPLVFGGTVVIADWETATDGKRLIEAIEREDIGLMQATPATWRMMLAAGWNGKSNLKILCGGEPMTPDLVEPLVVRCQELWNMYGPTETTVWSTLSRISSANSPIFIGRPIGNTQIYLLDSHGQEVPVGVEGEVLIGGAGVTRGYWNRSDLTQERFIDNPYFNPFEEYVNHRLYKTGDVAVYTLDGNIQYRRRNDKQIKLRGFRIELGEIETAVRSFPGVAQAVVIVRTDKSGDSSLVAYLTGSSATSIDELREYLRTILPHYMIPQKFMLLDSWPLTENGKINVKSLPEPEFQKVSEECAACQTPSEKYLEQVWKEVLQVEHVSRNDNFFDIGGHSLLVMKVINKVEAFTSVRLGPQEFLLGTLENLAMQLDDCAVLGEAEKTDDTATVVSEDTKQQNSSLPIGNVREVVADSLNENQIKSNSPFDLLKRFWS